MSDTSKPAKPSIISAYLDDEKPDNIAIYLVREVIRDAGGYMRFGAVQASDHAGWRVDPGTWLKHRWEYDDVGEHKLLTEAEAQAYLDAKGLQLEDGKAMLIAHYEAVNGYPPEILPEDPNLAVRRSAARAQRGLPDT